MQEVDLKLMFIVECMFLQLHPEMYALSNTFLKKMNCYFQIAFPEVMTHLEEVLINEGFNSVDGYFGSTPFTSFSLTRDYSCLPHDDSTDYGFGIIVWLHSSKFYFVNVIEVYFILYFYEVEVFFNI